MAIRELREEIPALERVTYLNTGASGPSTRSTLEAMRTAQTHQECHAPAEEGIYPAGFEAYERARERIVTFCNADPHEIALTESTGDGIARVAGAIDFDPGDVVAVTDSEHPAGILPWRHLERRGQLEVRTVETDRGQIDRDAFTEAVADARVCCLSAITWNYGTRLPVADLVDIARNAGAMTVVDAVQWPGQAPLDVTEWDADVLAASGHKWLLGPWGTGVLHVDDSIVASLEPAGISYRSVPEPKRGDPTMYPDARRFERGTANPSVHVALAAAIETMAGHGLDRVESEIQSLASHLVDRLPADRLLSPDPPETGLVTIDVTDPPEMVERLKREGIVVRAIPDPAAIRVSVHAFNTIEELDRLLEALEAAW